MEQDADGLVDREIWKYKHRRALFSEEEFEKREKRRLVAEEETLRNGNLLSLMKQERELIQEMRTASENKTQTDLQSRINQDKLLLIRKQIVEAQTELAIQNFAQFFQEELKQESLKAREFDMGSSLNLLQEATEEQKLDLIETLNLPMEEDSAKLLQSPAVTLIRPRSQSMKDQGFLAFMLEEYTFAEEIERRMTEYGGRSVYLPEKGYSDYIQQLKEKHSFKEIEGDKK